LRATAARQQAIVLIAIIVLCALAALLSLGFPARARVYPLTVALAAVALGLWDLVRSAKEAPRSEGHETPAAPPDTGGAMRAAGYLTWLGAYYVVIFLVGAVPASGAFVAGFLGRKAGVRWIPAIAMGTAMSLALLGLGALMGFRWPTTMADLWL
jgi:hypothetical protein